MSDEYNDEEEFDRDETDDSAEDLNAINDGNTEPASGGFGAVLVDLNQPGTRRQLRGMFQSWYIDYASYTILDRAIPHIADGLKPVQRRLLHAMKKLDDDRFIKVANIVGATMSYHPHGDASIYGALVQLGQKGLLVETQGNWGNTLTGDSAAAGRYIEARLSQFALDVLYNPKVTEWIPSYDGRSKEPITFPAKFPLLLAQGVGGIAAGLSSLILPHNFNELLDAAIAYLSGEPFTLYPDFHTNGGFIDVSRYNDGARGGKVRIRAKIEKLDSKTLAITEIPFSMTTASIKESIVKANEKGKIKIKSVEDYTSSEARIIVNLIPGTSSDKTIDALYAFTDCELSISPNCCVISDDKPQFLGVSDVLRHNADSTREIFRRELEIQLSEVNEQLHFASLERIFIEERIYKDAEFEQSASKSEAIAHIRKRLEPWKDKLIREVTDDDLLRLLEIRMARILRFSSRAADEAIATYRERIADINDKQEHLTEYTIAWFKRLKEKYGNEWQRRTVIRSFDNIAAANVAEANERLYYDAEDGFIGTSLKKGTFLFNCSSLDDVLVFYRDGRYRTFKVQDKVDVGKDILKMKERVDVDGVMRLRDVPQIFLFKRDDERTIYNVIYLNGDDHVYYMKRFALPTIKRDQEFNLTKGENSRIMWFSANPNGEAEVVRVILKPKARLKTLQFDVDFSTIRPKGRGALGNIVTKNEVHAFKLKEKGRSTLGDRRVWFDRDVLRLNYDERGEFLGEFAPTDRVLVILNNGEYYTCSFDASNHFDDNILRIERFRPGHTFMLIYNDAESGFPYVKRFRFEDSPRKQRYIGENEKSTLIALSDEPGARFEVTFGGLDATRPPMVITAPEVLVKSFRAKGRRLTTYQIADISEIEPIPTPEVEEDTESAHDEDLPEAPLEPERSDDELRDELTGQQRIF